MENKRFEITETAGSVKGFYVVVDKKKKNRCQLSCCEVWRRRWHLP